MEDHSPIARALQELEDLTGEDLKAAWAQLKAAEDVAWKAWECIRVGSPQAGIVADAVLDKALQVYQKASQA